jgi:signal transduction histidine kinase
MKPGRRFHSRSRRLLALLLLSVGPPAATLVWLGWRFASQDRAFLEKEAVERQRAVGQAVVRSLDEALTDAGRLPSGGPLPDGLIRLTLTSRGIEAAPSNRVLWLPVVPPMPEAEARLFADVERLEYQGDTDRALGGYLTASSKAPPIRAGALVRIARVHRTERRWDEAIKAYDALATIADVAFEGTPADLVARRAKCAVLEGVGRRDDLARESAALVSDVLAGRWKLDRAAYELTAADLERWTGRPLPGTGTHRVFSRLVDRLWEDQQRGAQLTPGRSLIQVDETPVTVLVARERGASRIVAMAPDVVSAWLDRLPASADPEHRVTVLSASGMAVAGTPPAETDRPITWTRAETGLPWIVSVSAGDGSRLNRLLATRQRQLWLGLAAILALLGGGSYFLWRVVQRELAVARLQTEFVAAVSHEFRTPLTSLRHVTELLTESDDVPASRRQAFYGSLGRNIDRLHGLVESLLDFARMESGRKPYDLQPIDAGDFAREVVLQFQKDVEPRGFTIEGAIDPRVELMVQADRAALANALWNLLDNAVKYSPVSRLVEVSVTRGTDHIAIAVRDRGLGIPRSEQKDVFDRFVRGTNAAVHAIKGTGLGLAMARHIAEAHGGRIDLESEDGVGSTFTIVLPAYEHASDPAAIVQRAEARS